MTIKKKVAVKSVRKSVRKSFAKMMSIVDAALAKEFEVEAATLDAIEEQSDLLFLRNRIAWILDSPEVDMEHFQTRNPK